MSINEDIVDLTLVWPNFFLICLRTGARHLKVGQEDSVRA